MARNLGRIRLHPLTLDGRPHGVPYADGTETLWKDHVEPTPGCIYLVVDGDGLIVGAGPDPSWNLIEGYDIWEVEGDDYKAAFGKHWDGEKVA